MPMWNFVMLSKLLAKSKRHSISGLVVEYIVAIDVTRVRSPADAFSILRSWVATAPHAEFFLPAQCMLLQMSLL